jgi:Tol biopolymer transport system component
LINTDGTGLEQVTTHPEFDGFPMFSPDGTKLVWEGNRRGKSIEDLDIYIADWVP